MLGNPNWLKKFIKVVTGGGGGGGATFTRVQYKHDYTLNGVTTTTAFTSSVTAGNLLLVFVSGFSNNSTACSDTQGNSYTMVEQIVGTGGAQMAVFSTVAGSSGACTVTITHSGQTDNSIDLYEYSGASGIDAHGNDTTSGSSVSLTTTHTAAFVGFWGNEASNTFTTPTLTGAISATLINHDSGHYDATFEWLNSGAGFAAGSYTASGAGTGGLIILALKA
jgi:hypothetical protein